jgi:hypothetical protein
MAVRMAVFSLMLLIVPVLALVWVRYVWQEASGLAYVELVRRTGLIVAAGVLAYVVLRLLGALASAIAHALENLDRRTHPWRW